MKGAEKKPRNLNNTEILYFLGVLRNQACHGERETITFQPLQDSLSCEDGYHLAEWMAFSRNKTTHQQKNLNSSFQDAYNTLLWLI